LNDLPIFDIIIDDGLHQDSVNLYTFNMLQTKLKVGGYYIIEDLREDSIFSNMTSGKFINKKSCGTPLDNYLWIYKKCI